MAECCLLAAIINPMQEPLCLDAHAHLDPGRTTAELAEAGAVLAMTLSLDEADKVVHRKEPLIAPGVFGVVYNGQLLSYRPMGSKTLRQMLEITNG